MITLPNIQLVTSWLLWLELPIGLINFRERSLACYKQAYNQDTIIPPEFSKAKEFSIDWDSFVYKKYKEKLVMLDGGAWKADLRVAYSRSHLVANILDKYNISSSTSLLQKLVNVAWNRSFVIYIPENYLSSEPLDLNELCSENIYEGLVISKVIIIVGKNAQVTFNYTHKKVKNSKKERSILSNVASIAHITGILYESSSVKFVKDKSFSQILSKKEANYTVTEYEWFIYKSARLSVVEAQSGIPHSYTVASYHLLEENGHIDHNIRSVVTADEKSVVITKQFHYAPYTQSSIIAKSALSQTASSFYKSIITIDQMAEYAYAQQKQTVLTLDPCVENYSVPSLEVKAHKVQCIHGSAAGFLNKEHVEYFCSRGFSKQFAQKMIIKGFLQSGNILPEVVFNRLVSYLD